MRITRDILLKAARTAVTQRTMYNHHVICIYLTGSLLMEEPLLGGTTDIDLFFIHDSDQPVQREVEKITDEIHLDIAHLSQAVFHQPRSLRADPWIGPFLCQNPVVLHDQQHWFEFTQASVCSQFNQPENALLRARPMADEARNLWMSLHLGGATNEVERVSMYLKALERAGNTIATLTGSPLTERRFFLLLPERAQMLGRPGLAAGLADLISGDPVSDETWKTWFANWNATLKSIQGGPAVPAPLQPCRLSYYTHAADALFSHVPAAAIWLLLRTWTKSLSSSTTPAALPPEFEDVLRTLGLDEAHFDDRLANLDAYLDQLEESIEVWSRENGVTGEQ
jgi:hypothetical protein